VLIGPYIYKCVKEKFLNMCMKNISRNIPHITLSSSNTEEIENNTHAGFQKRS
jgi:hypothetical protein